MAAHGHDLYVEHLDRILPALAAVRGQRGRGVVRVAAKFVDSFELVLLPSDISDACPSLGRNSRFLSLVEIIQRASASNRGGEQSNFLRTFEQAPQSNQSVNERATLSSPKSEDQKNDAFRDPRQFRTSVHGRHSRSAIQQLGGESSARASVTLVTPVTPWGRFPTHARCH